MGNRHGQERYRGEWRPDDRGSRGGYPRQDRFRSQMDDDVRSENYFGSGRQQFGGGESDYGSGTMSESSWRNTRFSDSPERSELGGGRNDRGYDPNYDPGARGSQRYSGGFGGSSNSYGGSRFGSRSSEPSSSGYDSYSTSNASRGGFGGGGNSMDRERYAGDTRGDERGWWDRASDEVASWFGDDDAERRRQADGAHRGRGPKNYKRSDERIKEDINDRLTDAAYLDASEIEVEVNDREVTLTGTVDSRNSKRMAEDIAESVSGVNNVENRIRVQNTDRWSGSGSSTGSSTSYSDSTVDNQASINQYRSATTGSSD